MTTNADIAIVWDQANIRGDFVERGAGLQMGPDLYTAMLISIFSDRLASPEDVIPDGSNDPRGWIGDLNEPYPIGSRLWLLDRSKATVQVELDANTYITEALQWMLDDGVVANLVIDVEYTKPGLGGVNDMLGTQVQAFQQNGQKVTNQFTYVWGQF